MGGMKVLIVDGRDVFREGFSRLLQEQEFVEAVSKCSSFVEAIGSIRDIKPDVVLIGTNISDCSSDEATRQIKKVCPEVKVAVLTDSKNRRELFIALESGATGFLHKDTYVDDLVMSIILISKGELVISVPMVEQLVSEFVSMKQKRATNAYGLSDREVEILRALTEGLTNEEVAERLFITRNTVKVHVRNLLAKLQLRNRQQLVAYAVREVLETETTDTR